MSKKSIFIGIPLLLLSEFILWYLFTPAINIFAPSFYLCILIPLVIFLLCSFGFKKLIITPLLILGGLTLIIGLTHLSFNDSSSKVHSDIAKVTNNGTFSESTLTVNSSFDLPIIDKESAKVISENLLKSNDNYVSTYTLSSNSKLIFYKESYYFVSPLEYVNPLIFDGIPGYTLVNIYTGEAKLVELEKPIIYAPTASLNQNLSRHLRMHYPFDIFGNENFEIDENGHPYYVVPTLNTRSLLYGGQYVKKILVVDAVTGEIQEYSHSTLPTWIDNVYDIERIMKEAKWYLDYNSSNLSWLSKTSDNSLTTRYHQSNEYCEFGKDNAIYLYTGVTLWSSPNNNIAFLVCNLRTGEIKYCYDYGIGEDSIQAAAQNLYLENQYLPSKVLLVNIEDEPVYYLTLKNHLYHVEQYALANQNSDTMFFLSGETVDEVLRNYYKLIGKPYPSIERDAS